MWYWRTWEAHITSKHSHLQLILFQDDVLPYDTEDVKTALL